jgi:uncharacterized protein
VTGFFVTNRFLTFLLCCCWVAPAAEPIATIPNRAPLPASAFYPLPLGQVKPQGWLLEQLRIQARGLSGHLDEFWPDLGPDSAWLGGSGEGWERGPYYLDGLVPLAFLLDDPQLIAKAKKWVEWTLTHQRPDGGIGPEKNKDWWPNFVMLKVLTQWQEATGDPLVIPLMQKYFTYQAKHIDERQLYEWAAYRWQEEVLSIVWLYNRSGDASLLDLARKLKIQGHDWDAQFRNFRYTEKVTAKADLNLATHGVNTAMAMKAPAIWSLISGGKDGEEGSALMMERLDRYHGLPNGMFSATEHYAGRDPSQGVELCAVVEAMFSLEQELAILGEAQLGDRLEKIAYNALPATMAPDLWSHQYDQQPNQISCTLARRDWTDNGPESNLFGLEPNFGCCTANLHQGWPKFAASLWMGTPDHGLAALAYGPSEVKALVGDGVPVIIDEQTEYPFRDSVRITVQPQRAATFPLVVRIPEWAQGAQIKVNGEAIAGVAAGKFFTIRREWLPGDRVELKFPMAVVSAEGFHDGVTIQRGPLVYALPVGENWRKLKQTGPASDWEIYPTSPWNYALDVASSGAQPRSRFAVEERAMGTQPYSVDGAPVAIHAKGRRVPEWQTVNESAGVLPASPVSSKQPEETLTLLPYGAVRLRITVFPTLAATQNDVR